jgi:aryl-alcohol dehydrogenase-like predicted oxidoreductase
MEYRYLGNSGLMVSALSLGGWVTYGKFLFLPLHMANSQCLLLRPLSISFFVCRC